MIKSRNIKFLLSLYIPFLGLFNGGAVFAQYNIGGTIVNNRQEPIGYAIVLLLNKVDSVVLETVLSDTSGKFTMSINDIEHKLVKVSAMGYHDGIREIGETMGTERIDFILLEDKQSLDEVTVSASKSLLERKVDRIVFNMGNSISTIGGTALEVIRKVPGVLVREQDNSINLIGKSGVQVLVNDRLLQLSGEDLMAYLQAMPANSIERVEIITTPPAKYDAAGNSGLINIVLKKNNKMGMNGNVHIGYEQASYAKGVVGGDINYQMEKINLYGNAAYTNGANNITERLNTSYTEQLFKVTDNYKRILKPLQCTLGADYELHKGGILGIQWISNNANRVNESKSGIAVFQSNTSILDSSMLTTGYSTAKNSNNILNLNYVWHVDTLGTILTFNANRLWFTGRRSNDFGTLNYYGLYLTPTGVSNKNKSNGRQDINITTAQADFELPYTFASLSFGGKLSFIDNKSNNRFGHYEQGVYYEDPEISNAFDYWERIQALYVNAQKTIGKWSFQAGLRGEFTETKGYSLNLNQTNTNRYFNLFPTAYIQFRLDEDNNWNLNYSKRINRPDYRSLDPFRAYATPYHYNEGNPFLLPSFTHNLELAYTLKSRFTFSAFYQYEHNHFASVWLADPVAKVTSGLSMNFADFIGYGVNVMGMFQPVAWWEMQLQLSVQQQELKSEIYTVTEQSYRLGMYYADLNSSFALNKRKTLLTEVNIYYLSKYREDFLEINPIGSMDFALKMTSFKKKLTIGLAVNDIFASQKASGKHVVTGQSINNYFDTRNVRLSLNYKFGNNNIKTKRGRDTGIEEEKGRAG